MALIKHESPKMVDLHDIWTTDRFFEEEKQKESRIKVESWLKSTFSRFSQLSNEWEPTFTNEFDIDFKEVIPLHLENE